MEQMNQSDRPTRRGFLDLIVAAGSAVTAAAIAVPGLLYLWPAARGGADEDVEVKGAADMTPGEAVTIQVRGKAVIVLRRQRDFVAYSAVCTHLGCLVKWDAAQKQFLCPCHAAVFDAEGRIVSGPAPADMPAYRVKEIGEALYVAAS